MGGKVCQILILIFCLFAGCVKDKPDSRKSASATGSVYIVCEGNFGNGDASLYVYDRIKDSVYGDVFKQANSQSLGDVFQSMVRIGDRFFLCINNSDKVVVINAADKKLMGTISIPKPRYILPISETKAYVSTLYSNKVYIINPQTLVVSGTIALPYKNTEGMYLYNGVEAFICTWDTASNKIFKVNTNTDVVIDSYKISGFAPQEIIADKQQLLWVLSGNRSKGKVGALTRIDPSTGAILKSFQFTAEVDALKPVFNKALDSIYFIEVNYLGNTEHNGIYRMPIDAPELPSQPFIAAQQNQYFWGLGIDLSGHIYVGDPKGFTQKGNVYVYKQDGSLISSLNVGLGPGHFYFDN